MNVDDSSYTSKVVSKYFCGKSAMDESLTEFKEKKTNNTGPKNTQKSNVNKNKPKKPLKRIKGQKDIRTVLKKKNELISYAKEFDDVCKQSGVDVDSEQLQLAIALSKSLEPTESTCEGDTQSSSKSGSQERAAKIRTTLQQYGFKVPNTKITTTTSRKTKKYRKNYKLLSLTEAEKNQIISDKYSQILLENIERSKIHETDTNVDVTKFRLFHIASSISYNCMKDIDTFYVDNLLEISYSTGCLLRNWSDIPGRPESPKLIEDNSMNFTEIECSQEELDVILSGSLKITKTIIKSKHKSKCASIHNECDEIIIDDHNHATKLDDNSVLVIENEVPNKDRIFVESDVFSNDVIKNDIEDLGIEPKSITIPQQCRSCSPDIFDDELSVVDTTITTAIKSQEVKTVEESDHFMDLTECVNVKDLGIETKQKTDSQLSQRSNITKRKSDDFMEITECIVSSSQAILVNYENIDLTQSADNYNSNKVVEADGDKIVCLDLTQSSYTSDELPFVEIGGQMQKSLDDTIILNDNEYLDINNKITKPNCEELEIDNEEIDLTQGKYASPVRCIENVNHTSSFEEYTNDHSNKSKELSPSDINHENLITKPIEDSIKENYDIDLTQSSSSEDDDKNANSFTTPKILCNNSHLGKNDDRISIDYDELFDSIDKSKAISAVNTSNKSLSNKSSNSFAYDKTNDDIQIKNSLENTSNCSASDLSQNSRVFEIVDHEFNYSLHKSRLDIPMDNFDNDHSIEEIQFVNTSNDIALSSSESPEAIQITNQEYDILRNTPNDNFEFGGISILDNFSNPPSLRKTMNNINNAIANNLDEGVNDSYLPVIDLKNTNNKTETLQKEVAITTPINKINKIKTAFKTPSNKDYIIKTEDVTPMLDYASMSTPERNKELDKYGLKPFKRKRAIQLLTHLYNQTHPIVEFENEDLPSPSKKPKHSRNKSTENSPIKKLRSPRKPEVTEGGETQEVVYEESNGLPIIKNIDCDEDDWIFQKREKAKVHSCRVPLHIAFYNYVLSRRGLREAILRYEPVNIDVIHKDLVGYGHRYDPKDLLKFMDKRCITVKTTDNNSRNTKR